MMPPTKSRAFYLALLLASAFIALSCILLIKPSASTRAAQNPKAALSDGVPPSNLSSLSDAEVAALLSKSEIGSLEPEESRLFGAAIVPRAVLEDIVPEEYAASFFPSPSEILAMLARDRDVDDYLENAAEKGPTGAYYQAVADMVPSMKPLRGNYEMFFAGAYGALREWQAQSPRSRHTPIPRSKKRSHASPLVLETRTQDYDYSHTSPRYLLDNVGTLPSQPRKRAYRVSLTTRSS